MAEKKKGRYRYTDDYKRVSYVTDTGKKKERLEYIGEWICPLNSTEDYFKIILWLRICTAAALIAVLFGLYIVPTPLYSKWYLAAMAVLLFPLAYAVIGAVLLPNHCMPMEKMRYQNSFVRLRHSAVACLIFLAFTVILYILYWILLACGVIADASPFTLADGLVVFSLLITGMSCLMISRKAAELKTETKENSAYRP